MAACSGGIITAGALGHLAEQGRLGDVAEPDAAGLRARQRAGGHDRGARRPGPSRRRRWPSPRGAATSTATRWPSVFSWLRPNDLIWNYVVNNYLLGKEPPAFDILYWNQDTVRMAAGLHRDFVMMALDSALATPGRDARARQRRGPGQGRPRHLHRRRVQRPHRRLAQRLPLDAAARRRQPVRALHQRPHPGADQPAESGQPVQLPDRRRQPAGHRRLGGGGDDAPRQLVARLHRLAADARSGERVPAPKRLGSRAHKAIAKAPGTYVLAA